MRAFRGRVVWFKAARYRKATLARRLPVLQELLESKEAAILLGQQAPLDNRVELSADELGAEMFRLLVSPAERKRIGENAFTVSQKFLWPVITTRFENAYKEALN